MLISSDDCMKTSVYLELALCHLLAHVIAHNTPVSSQKYSGCHNKYQDTPFILLSSLGQLIRTLLRN